MSRGDDAGPSREWTGVADIAAARTVAHVAPEALRAGSRGEYEANPRQDSFSVGILMLLLLCRSLPWRGKTPEQVHAMVQDGSITSCLAECGTGAPAAYVNIALWLCSHNPDDRILCVRAYAMLERLHAATVAGISLGIEDLAREFNCPRHNLLGQFRIEEEAGSWVDAAVLDRWAESPADGGADRGDTVEPGEASELMRQGSFSCGESAAGGDSLGSVMLPCPPAALLHLNIVRGDKLKGTSFALARSEWPPTASETSAEIPAVGSGCAGALLAAGDAPGSPAVVPTLIEEWFQEGEAGEVAPGSGSRRKEGEVKGGWMRRLRAKCQAVPMKGVPRNRC